MKTVIYELSEYSYMSEIYDKPNRAKQRMAPRLATPLYDSRFASMLSEVILALMRACSILTDFVLAISRV
jgi:hypothetical protein